MGRHPNLPTDDQRPLPLTLQGVGVGVDHLRRGMVVADGLPDRAIKTWLPPIPGVQEPAEGSLFTHLFTTAHNYMDGAEQNSTIWTLARPVYPQVRTVLAGQQGIFMNGHLSDFNPAGRVRDPGGPQTKAQVRPGLTNQ